MTAAMLSSPMCLCISSSAYASASSAHAVRPRRPAVRVGERESVDLGRERTHALLVGHDLRGERHREQRPAVEGVVERHDRGTPRRLARDLHRVLDGLGAGVGEHRLLREVPGRERVQPFGELDVRLVRGDVEAGVRVQLELPLRGRDHLGRGVADVQDGDAGGQVDQPVAVDVLDDRAGGSRGHDRVDVGHALGDGGRAPREPLGRLRTGDLGDELALLRDVHACVLLVRRGQLRRRVSGRRRSVSGGARTKVR